MNISNTLDVQTLFFLSHASINMTNKEKDQLNISLFSRKSNMNFADAF
jgi:hypothetical protein